ncbi:hypothetical protein D5282_04035 [bacterium 1xD8-48]|mgnify:FL=1|nr:hypothetical protein [bacterium 1xD8-48]
MDYTMEELIPIVGELAEKYTAKESTSITYEKAEQLMGAVLYAIHETELSGPEGGDDAVTGTAQDKSAGAKGTVLVQKRGMTARQAYEEGMALVEKKVRKTLAMYNEMMPEFSDYGNICLYDTVVREMPEFFKWYDIRFNPKDTILTLDYPVTRDLSGYTGIDRIYEYLKCIRKEQDFLHSFPESYVRGVLRKYCFGYQEMIENIYEIVANNEK